LQPHPESKFDGRLAMLRSRPDSTTTLLADPFRMHEILIATYFDNWRWYLREMADMFKSDVSNSCSYKFVSRGVPTLMEPIYLVR
jgi:hypothetical protein